MYKSHLNIKYKRLFWLSIAFDVEKEKLRREFGKKKKDPKLAKKHKKQAEALNDITQE
jgi:hypothetical protein